jgi:hypothetical protein
LATASAIVPRSSAFLFDIRIDRDLRPLYRPFNAELGDIVDRYPFVSKGWTDDNVGDFYVGAKVNQWSEYRQQPGALTVRGKLPKGDDEAGVSTGATNFRSGAPSSCPVLPATRERACYGAAAGGRVTMTVTVSDGQGTSPSRSHGRR